MAFAAKNGEGTPQEGPIPEMHARDHYEITVRSLAHIPGHLMGT